MTKAKEIRIYKLEDKIMILKLHSKNSSLRKIRRFRGRVRSLRTIIEERILRLELMGSTSKLLLRNHLQSQTTSTRRQKSRVCLQVISLWGSAQMSMAPSTTIALHHSPKTSKANQNSETVCREKATSV